MAEPFALPLFHGFDASGAPLDGGKLWTYESGTSIPAATYQDSTATVQNPNPVILDARGEATVFLLPDQLYTFFLTDANDVPVWSFDGVAGVTSSIAFGQFEAALAGESGASLVGFRQLGVDAIPRTTQAKLRETVSVKDFGAVGDGATDDTASIQRALNFAAAQGGLGIYIPSGVYLVSPRVESDYILAIGAPRIGLFGDSMQTSVIKVVPGTVTNYLGILGSRVQGEDWAVQDICFDHNQAGNPQPDAAAYTARGRYTVSCFPAPAGPDNIVLHNVKVVNADSVVCFYFPQNTARAQRVTIQGCQFVDLANALQLNYDQSIVNIACDEAVISGCVFSALSWNDSPRTAIETHAGKIVVTGNVINKFQVGANITGLGSAGTDANIVVSSNTMEINRVGIFLWSNKKDVSDTNTVGLRNVVVSGNTILHRWDLWPEAYGNTERRLHGISFFNTSDALAVENLSITGNIITYTPVPHCTDRSTLGVSASTAIALVCSVTQSMPWINVSIADNQIRNAPNCPLIIEYGVFNGLDIRNNVLIDCGGGLKPVSATYGLYQMYLTPSLTSDARIVGNSIVNNEATTTIGTLFYVRERSESGKRFLLEANAIALADAVHITISAFAMIFSGTRTLIRGIVPYADIALPSTAQLGSELFAEDNQFTYRTVSAGGQRVVSTSRLGGFPPGTTVARGSIDYNLNVSPNGKIGTVVTTAGVVGSTAVIKPFGAIDA